VSERSRRIDCYLTVSGGNGLLIMKCSEGVAVKLVSLKQNGYHMSVSSAEIVMGLSIFKTRKLFPF